MYEFLIKNYYWVDIQYGCLISCHSALGWWAFQNIVTVSWWSSGSAYTEESPRWMQPPWSPHFPPARSAECWGFFAPYNHWRYLWDRRPALSSWEGDIKFFLVTRAASCLASEPIYSTLWPVQITSVTLLNTPKLGRTIFHHRCCLAHVNSPEELVQETFMSSDSSFWSSFLQKLWHLSEFIFYPF